MKLMRIGNLGEELAAGAVVLPEFGDAYTDDGDPTH